MKKILTVFVAFVMMFASLATLAACGKNLSEVEQAIQDAQEMTLDELVEAAKAEIGDNKLLLSGITSGFTKAGAKFTEKYGIAAGAPETAASKDVAQYELLNAAASAGDYYVDVVLGQDVFALQDMIDNNRLFNYIPKDIASLNVAEGERDPLTGIMINKIFMQNKATDMELYNVWQLAGSATDEDHIPYLSFQNPSNEAVNMNFLVSLTSPEAIAKLKTAYKSYYGTDYVDTSAYENIGYKYIAEYIANVSSLHSSDTTLVKEVLSLPEPTNPNLVGYVPINKYKDAGAEKAANLQSAGVDFEVEGFAGFMYKMYLQVTSTSKYPLTACLFIRFMLTEEGFNAGWGGNMGYYSPNSSIPIATGDKTLAHWSSRLLFEDINHLAGAYDDVSLFVRTEVAKKA